MKPALPRPIQHASVRSLLGVRRVALVRLSAVAVFALGCNGSDSSPGGGTRAGGSSNRNSQTTTTNVASGGLTALGGSLGRGGVNTATSSTSTSSSLGGTGMGGQASTASPATFGGSTPMGGSPTGGTKSAASGTTKTAGAGSGGVSATSTQATGGKSSGGAQHNGGAGGIAGRSGVGGATVAASGSASAGAASVQGPCDIYAVGNTPCVAAHSTVRALYGAYAGKLYQVQRASDNSTKDISVLSPGGFADSASQDTFCASTTCTISIIYDQSPKGNHLTPAPGGGAVKTPDKPVNAAKLKLKVGGHTVYGAYFEGGMGYRNNSKTTGLAKNDEPESMYMVASGKHYNNQCCWDYGNAETTNNDDGEGTMEAIYFGNCDFWGKGSGSGPWIMADIENGLWAGNVTPANGNTPMTSEYVTAMVKGKPHTFAIKGGDATTGKLKTMWEGAYPAKGATGKPYDPMQKQGAIILGIGGDNSNSGIGTFFEGCITTGYSSNDTDEAIQANIVAAGYGQ